MSDFSTLRQYYDENDFQKIVRKVQNEIIDEWNETMKDRSENQEQILKTIRREIAEINIKCSNEIEKELQQLLEAGKK